MSSSTRFLNLNSSGDLQQYSGQQTSSGAAAGDIVALNGSAKIDSSLLPSIAASYNTASESASFSALINYFYSVSLTSGSVVATLPDATTCDGETLMLQVSAAGTGHSLSLATVSSQTVNGASVGSMPTLSNVAQTFFLISDGSNWWTVSPVVDLAHNVTGTLGVANGGTGQSSLTAHNVLVGNGTSAVTEVAPSATSGLALVSGGSSANPAFGAVALGASGAVSGVLPVLNAPNVITATAGATNITAGMMVYINSSGLIEPADNTTPVKAIGFAPAAITAGTSGQVVIGGGPNSALTGLTEGSDYFLGAAGAVTATLPSTAGYISQKVGTAVSSTLLMVNLSMPITLS